MQSDQLIFLNSARFATFFLDNFFIYIFIAVIYLFKYSHLVAFVDTYFLCVDFN